MATGSGSGRKEAKEAAAVAALADLQKHCYTIIVKNRFSSGDGTTVNANTLEITGKFMIPSYIILINNNIDSARLF